MANHEGEDDGVVFIYRGGRAPEHVTHVRIDESVDDIEARAFLRCENLLQVEAHDGIRKVGSGAFFKCRSLRWISNLKSAVDIGSGAFHSCENLESVDFGDKLETIGNEAFYACTSLKTPLKLPSIIRIEHQAFLACFGLTDIELSERLQTLGGGAFYNCKSLQHVAIPMKRDLLEDYDAREEYSPFDHCDQLATVDVVGDIHKTVASLHMDSWRTEMDAEINRINQVLPTTRYQKTDEIRQWMELLINKIDHYKAEHYLPVKEGMTLLELALWKAKLGEKDECSVEGRTKNAKVDAESSRMNKRITCGADMVIKNVLPFLQLE